MLCTFSIFFDHSVFNFNIFCKFQDLGEVEKHKRTSYIVNFVKCFRNILEMKKNFINDFTYIFYCRKAKMISIMAIGTTFFFYTNMLMDGTVSTIGVYVKLNTFQP